VTFSVQAFNIAGHGPLCTHDFVVWESPVGPTAGTLTVGALDTTSTPNTQKLHIAWTAGNVVPDSFSVFWYTVDGSLWGDPTAGAVAENISPNQLSVDIDGLADLSIPNHLSNRTVQFTVYAFDVSTPGDWIRVYYSNNLSDSADPFLLHTQKKKK